MDVFLNKLNNIDVTIVCDVDKIKANKVSQLLKSRVVYNEEDFVRLKYLLKNKNVG